MEYQDIPLAYYLYYLPECLCCMLLTSLHATIKNIMKCNVAQAEIKIKPQISWINLGWRLI